VTGEAAFEELEEAPLVLLIRASDQIRREPRGRSPATRRTIMGRLEGRTAIVTGAGQGIGRGIAELFADEGASVTLASRTFERVEQLAKDIDARGGRALPLQCDVSDRAAVERVVEATATEFGPPTILVNNAQGAVDTRGPLIDMSDDDMIATFRGGPLASLAAMQACFPYMKEAGGGAIVNLASTTGLIGAPGLSAYGVAKEAIRGLTKHASQEWGQYGITVNVICPAALTEAVKVFFDANPAAIEGVAARTPLGRMGDSRDDIAPVVLGLVTDFHYVTGATIMVDGGAVLLR
jgi:NAD(P)-dependent dehydrogenase (short-subunit alcohol dehydrogenase family)